MGKSSINVPFSMAMLNNQRVYLLYVQLPKKKHCTEMVYRVSRPLGCPGAYQNPCRKSSANSSARCPCCRATTGLKNVARQSFAQKDRRSSSKHRQIAMFLKKTWDIMGYHEISCQIWKHHGNIHDSFLWTNIRIHRLPMVSPWVTRSAWRLNLRWSTSDAQRHPWWRWFPCAGLVPGHIKARQMEAKHVGIQSIQWSK